MKNIIENKEKINLLLAEGYKNEADADKKLNKDWECTIFDDWD